MNSELAGRLALEPRHLQMVLELLCRHVPDRSVYAFGSRAFGQSRRYSDLDLAIAGREPLRASEHYDLEEAFDRSLLPIEVDVIDLNDVNPAFRERIQPDFIELRQGSGVNS